MGCYDVYTWVSALRTLILCVDMNRSTSAVDGASPSGLCTAGEKQQGKKWTEEATGWWTAVMESTAGGGGREPATNNTLIEATHQRLMQSVWQNMQRTDKNTKNKANTQYKKASAIKAFYVKTENFCTQKSFFKTNVPSSCSLPASGQPAVTTKQSWDSQRDKSRQQYEKKAFRLIHCRLSSFQMPN